jgi:hypothetical protein
MFYETGRKSSLKRKSLNGWKKSEARKTQQIYEGELQLKPNCEILNDLLPSKLTFSSFNS